MNIFPVGAEFFHAADRQGGEGSRQTREQTKPAMTNIISGFFFYNFEKAPKINDEETAVDFVCMKLSCYVSVSIVNC